MHRPSEHSETADPGHHSEKHAVALSSVLAAVFLTSVKTVVGLSTGSLGILSEAAHSALDLVAAAITLLAVRASSRPADLEHPYGHGKVENLSALVEAFLLLITCVWIVYEAARRLLFVEVEVEPSAWAFVIMATSILVDLSRSRALRRVALKTGSQALEADALHFSTDVWSSSVVIGGLGLVWLARELDRPALARADAVAALAVAAIVVWVSLRLGRRTVAELLDAAPEGLPAQVVQAVQVDGVRDVIRVRARRSGPEAFVDFTLRVDPGTSLERAHCIADAAEAAVRKVLPGADVVVHVEPGDEPAAVGSDSVPAVVRRVSASLGLAAHSLHLHQANGGLSLELHIEVPGNLSVEEAHAVVSALETALREASPDLHQVTTHIEPVEPCLNPAAASPSEEQDILSSLEELGRRHGLSSPPHDVALRREGADLHLSCHWTVDGDASIAETHRLTEAVERALQVRFPELTRVLIHVEPPDAG